MLQNKKTEFQKEIDVVLKPKLLELGFQEIMLDHCMRPEVLFNNGRLWFSASWDYRDQYLEIRLGHLFWIKDVMPHIIVLGDYVDYYSKLKDLPTNTSNYLRTVVEFIRDSIKDALIIYEDRYEAILAESKNPKKFKYPKEFLILLGGEVSKCDLERFMT